MKWREAAGGFVATLILWEALALLIARPVFPPPTQVLVVFARQITSDLGHLLNCSPAHPLYRDAEARDFDLKVLQGAGYASWADQDAFVQSPFPLSPQTSIPFMDGIACLILSGQYIGYLPEYFAERWVAQGLLRPLWSTATSRTARIVVVRRKADAMKRATSLMVETLLEAHSTSRGPVAAPVA